MTLSREGMIALLLGSGNDCVRWDDVLSVMENLPAFLVKFRRARGIHQTDAARRIGISDHTLSRFERNAQVVSLDTALNIIRWIVREQAKHVAEQAQQREETTT